MYLQIRQERIQRGWTQKYVAEKIGLTKTAVCDMETGKQKPSYTVLVKLEDLFKLNHRALFAAVQSTPCSSFHCNTEKMDCQEFIDLVSGLEKEAGNEERKVDSHA